MKLLQTAGAPRLPRFAAALCAVPGVALLILVATTTDRDLLLDTWLQLPLRASYFLLPWLVVGSFGMVCHTVQGGARALAALLAFGAVLAAQLRCLALHDLTLTWSQRAALLTCAGLLIYWRRRDDFDAPPAYRRWLLHGADLAGSAALALAFGVALIPEEPLELLWTQHLPWVSRNAVTLERYTGHAPRALRITRRLFEPAPSPTVSDRRRLGLGIPLPTPWRLWPRVLRVTGALPDELDLRGRDLRYARLDHTTLRRLNASTEAATGVTDLRGASLVGANLQGASLVNSLLSGTRLDGADLTQAKLNHALMLHARLDYSGLIGADLRRARLLGASLYDADLRGADLSRADLRNAILDRTQLQGARLSGADLRGTSLAHAMTENVESASSRAPESAPPSTAANR